jgi:Domain of unknown function (DUF2382)
VRIATPRRTSRIREGNNLPAREATAAVIDGLMRISLCRRSLAGPGPRAVGIALEKDAEEPTGNHASIDRPPSGSLWEGSARTTIGPTAGHHGRVAYGQNVVRVIVEKRPVVKEEVKVGKRVVRDLEKVGGEVRKEEVRVEREEVVDIHDRGTGESSTRSVRAGIRVISAPVGRRGGLRRPPSFLGCLPHLVPVR